MDISFKTEAGKFNYRVCGIILFRERILAMRDERSPYYYLPGGRVTVGETAEDAVIREIQEELALTPRIVRPLWLCQAFFSEDVNRLNYHELCLYYLLDVSDTDLLSRGEAFTLTEGKHTLTFEWLRYSALKDLYFYPLFLKEKIFRLPETLTPLTTYE